MGWKDRQDSAVKDAEPEARHPYAQWVNRGGDLDPRHDRGGFFISVENLAMLGDPDIPGAEAVTFHHSTNDYSTGVLLQEIQASIIIDRFAWSLYNEATRRTSLSMEYVEGARGKRQALVLLKTVDGYVGPMMITLTGMVSKDMDTATATHRQMVRQATGGEGATAWFWATLGAGEPVRLGKGATSSMGTPILYREPEGGLFNPDALYIGDEAADQIEAAFGEFQTWANAWEERYGKGAAASTVHAEDNEDYTGSREEPPPFDTEPQQAPLPLAGSYTNVLGNARKGWSTAWNALKMAGIVPPFLNNSWSEAQINRCRDIFEEALTLVASGSYDKEALEVDLATRAKAL